MGPSTQPALFTEGEVVAQRYRVSRLLGSGAMGAVYEALHLGLGQRVALKVLKPELFGHAEVRERFLREGRVAARVPHPNVVAVSDVGEHQGAPFLVMEFLDGEGLDQRLKRVGAMSPADALDVALPVVAALDAAHRAGVVHRDLKPSNIFLARGADGVEVPKVLDFGISKIVDEEALGLTGTAQMLGTPQYMSPEQISSPRSVDARTDQYSLGVVLYLCLTGRRPFSGETAFHLMTAIVRGDYAAPRSLAPDLPPELERVVVTALQASPARRFASMLDLGVALLPFASPLAQAVWSHRWRAPAPAPLPALDPRPASVDPGTLAPAAVPVMPAAPARPSRVGVVLAAALALASLGVLAAVIVTRPPSTPRAASAAALARPSSPPPAPAPAPPAPPPVEMPTVQALAPTAPAPVEAPSAPEAARSPRRAPRRDARTPRPRPAAGMPIL
ncbi:MAG: serine/threonine-protein kinase [Polyangiales bacterium]